MGGRKKFTICAGNIEITGIGPERKLVKLLKLTKGMKIAPPKWLK